MFSSLTLRRDPSPCPVLGPWGTELSGSSLQNLGILPVLICEILMLEDNLSPCLELNIPDFGLIQKGNTCKYLKSSWTYFHCVLFMFYAQCFMHNTAGCLFAKSWMWDYLYTVRTLHSLEVWACSLVTKLNQKVTATGQVIVQHKKKLNWFNWSKGIA